MKYAVITLLVLMVVIGAVIFVLAPSKKGKVQPTQMRTFEECQDAGNLVVETLPRECHTKDKKVFVEVYNGTQLKDVINVETPKLNAEVSSPFELSGSAVGDWFQNGILNVKLVDLGGNIIATKTVRATADTQTEGFVPFAAAIEYDASQSALANLIIERTNPAFTRAALGPLIIPLRLKAN